MEAMDVLHLLLRTLPHSQHQDHRTDTDDHTQHGQEGAQPVGTHRSPGFAEHGADHDVFSRCSGCGMLDGTVIHDAAVGQAHQTLRIGGDVRLMRDEDDGDAVALVQVAEQRHDLLAGMGIEIAGWFVCQQQLGIG